jgi:hypothetical protein
MSERREYNGLRLPEVLVAAFLALPPDRKTSVLAQAATPWPPPTVGGLNRIAIAMRHKTWGDWGPFEPPTTEEIRAVLLRELIAEAARLGFREWLGIPYGEKLPEFTLAFTSTEIFEQE